LKLGKNSSLAHLKMKLNQINLKKTLGFYEIYFFPARGKPKNNVKGFMEDS